MFRTSKLKKAERAKLVIGFTLLLTCNLLGAEPIVHLTVENDRVIVTVSEVPDLSKTPVAREINRELIIRIEDKSSGKATEFTFTTHLRKINSFEFCAGNRGLLIGELPGSGGNMTIININEGKVQDNIWAYGCSISPSKRFLVYKTWHPRLGPMNLRKSIVLIYDITGTQASNRFPTVTEYSYRNAGLPIFPEANAYFAASDPNSLGDGTIDLKAYDVNLDDEYGVLSPFLWSDDEKQLVFFVFNRDEQTNHLVQIDLSNGVENPAIFRKFIDVNALIKWDIMLDVTKKELEKRPCRFGVKSLQWAKDKNRIIVHPYPQYWLNKEIIFTLPK